MTDPLIEAAPLGSSDLWPEEHHLVLVLGMLVICRVVRLATYVVLVSPLMKHTALVAVISLGGEQTVAVAPQWILVFELLGIHLIGPLPPSVLEHLQADVLASQGKEPVLLHFPHVFEYFLKFSFTDFLLL